jgi:hypothetical protein
MDIATARRLHDVVEPCHAFIYFAPEGKVAYGEAGLKGQWMGYFASRSAPMGAVSAPVVISTFYGFAPEMVYRAIPDAWTLSTPEVVLGARFAVADQSLRRMWGDLAGGPQVQAAAELMRAAVESAECAGRPLGAAHQALPWPDEPHLAVWHGASVLREHRGDGHVATLVANDLDPRASLMTIAAVKPSYGDFVRNFRGWTPEELDETVAGLRARGLVDGEGLATDACRALRDGIERDTDRLAVQPYLALGEEGCERLIEALTPLAAAIKGG